MSSDTRQVNLLDRIAEVLAHQVPDLEWQPSRGLVRRGAVRGPLYRIGLGRRGNFAWFLCHGLTPSDPRRLLEITSGLVGPSRLVQSPHVAVAHLEATWPWRLSPEGQANLLAADLHLLLGHGNLPATPIVDARMHRPRATLMPSDGLIELPAGKGCWEARLGRGRAAMQVTFHRPHAQAISISTFVANWTAESDLEEQAAAHLATMMNGRLRWVRLVLRDTAINAAITVPEAEFGEQAWALGRDALAQAIQSCRAALRLVQTPSVAAEFLRRYPLRTGNFREMSKNA